MNTNKIYNGKWIYSSAKPLPYSAPEEVRAEFTGGYILLWQHHGVFVGIIQPENQTNYSWLPHPHKGKEPIMEQKHHLRFRVFDRQKEFHFWRKGQGWAGRLRQDHAEAIEDNHIKVVPAQQNLLGVIGQPLTTIDKFKMVTENDSIGLLTQNYIGYNHLHQAGYIDQRFMGFDIMKAKGNQS